MTKLTARIEKLERLAAKVSPAGVITALQNSHNRTLYHLHRAGEPFDYDGVIDAYRAGEFKSETVTEAELERLAANGYKIIRATWYEYREGVTAGEGL